MNEKPANVIQLGLDVPSGDQFSPFFKNLLTSVELYAEEAIRRGDWPASGRFVLTVSCEEIAS